MEKKIIVIPKGGFCSDCQLLDADEAALCLAFIEILEQEEGAPDISKCSACLNKTPIEIVYEDE